MLSGEMWTEREFALAEYLPFMLVGFYPLFQERGRPKLERPKATWDVRTPTSSRCLLANADWNAPRTAPCRDNDEPRNICVTLAVPALSCFKTSWRLQAPRQRPDSPAGSGSVPEPHHFSPAEPRTTSFSRRDLPLN